MKLVQDRETHFSRKMLIALLFVEILTLWAALMLPPEKSLFLAICLAGGLLLVLLPVFPLIFFPLMIVATALDTSGKIIQDTRLFTAFDFPLTVFHLAGGGTIVFCIANYLFRKRVSLPKLELTVPLIFYLSILGFSVVYSPNRLEGVTHFIRLSFLAFLIFVTVLLVESKRAITLVVASTIICGVAMSGWAIIQAFTQRYFLPASFVRAAGVDIPRASASFHNPNSLGTFLMVAVILAAAPLVSMKLSLWKKTALVLTLAVLFGGLITTFSRANWMAVGISIFFVMLLSHRLRMLSIIVIVFIVVIGVTASFSPTFAELVFDRFTSIFRTFTEFKSYTVVSATARIQFVQGAFSMFLDHPLLGIGVRGFPILFDKYKPADFPIWLPTRECHTFPAIVIAELGIVGSIAALWLMIAIIKAGLGAVRTIRDDYLKSMAIGLLCVFIGFQISMLFTADIGNNFFWIMTGMLFAVKKIAENAEKGGGEA